MKRQRGRRCSNGNRAVVKWPQARELGQTPESGELGKHISPRVFGGHMVLGTRQFQTSDLQNCKRLHFCCDEPPEYVGICPSSPEIHTDGKLELGGTREADGCGAQTGELERWAVGCRLSETASQEVSPLLHV